MPPQNLYQVLGVKKSATPQEIKKAYRKIARATHPDVKPGDAAAEKRFKEATAAFEVLSDEKKKKLYDEFGDDALRMGFDPKQARAYRSWQGRPRQSAGGFEGFPPGGYGFGGSEGPGGFDLGEILGDLFGGSGKKRGAQKSPFGGGFGGEPPRQRGSDTEASMRITLREAVLGGSREISIDKPRACGTCKGTGRTGSTVCSACGGSGIREGGKSRLKVKIPPGVGDGQKIRLAGQGLPGSGGASPGDLLVKVEIAPHPLLRREGGDLYLDLPITLSEAIYGASVCVPTFQGEVKVKIPPESQSGRKLRLKGRGMPKSKGEPGDLYLVLSVRLPSSGAADPEVEKAVEILESRYQSSPRDGIVL